MFAPSRDEVRQMFFGAWRKYRDGIPLAVREGDFVRELAPVDAAIAREVSTALSRRRAAALFSR